MPRVEPEGNGGSEGECRVLADVVVVAGVPGVYGAGLHRVHHLERGDDFSGREYTDREASVRKGRDPVRDEHGGPVENVHTRGEARGHSPADSGAGGDTVSVRAWCFGAPAASQNAGSGGSKTGFLDEISAIQMVHGAFSNEVRAKQTPSVEKILDGGLGHLAHGVSR